MSTKSVLTCELFSEIPKEIQPLFEKHSYPWQILPELAEYLKTLVKEGVEGYSELFPGVLIGENVRIEKSAVIEAPAVIGKNTEIRTGAYIRGSVYIGEGSVIGNSSEIKNSVLISRVQVPHYNYVGDSVLGKGAHLGAGAICSNLKSDGKNVTVHGDEEYETGMRKLGAILGDYIDIGCGSVLNPGTVVGRNTNVYPLTALRGVYPSDSIVKSADNIVKKA